MQTTAKKTVSPILYLSHDGIAMALGDNDIGKMGAKLNKQQIELGKKLRSEYDIKFIIFMSAHYMRKDFSVVSNPNPETIHDHGIEQYMQFRYPAKNDVELAQSICEDLNKSNIKCVMDDTWGYDHGVWDIANALFPDASEYPVLSISHSTRYDAQEHIDVGKILRRYREEKGALLIFSASPNHNPRELIMIVRDGYETKNGQIYRDFEEFLRKNALQLTGQERQQHIMQYKNFQGFRVVHPTDDHWIPYLSAIGAAGELQGKLQIDAFDEKTMFSCTSFIWD